jgi:hypothetical protein
MTIDDLMDALSDAREKYSGELEVRLAHQPSWPLQFKAEGAQVAKDQKGERRFYIGEGGTCEDSPYVPYRAQVALGWREARPGEDSEDDEDDDRA